MPKPIRITDEMKTAAQAEFAELLKDLKMSDGEICYEKSFEYEKASATLWLTQLAYNKTVALVNHFSDEVAWHGSVTRTSPNEFVIEDIFIYPQEVTGATVSTDQEGYTKWLYGFDDEAFAKMRMQGHSHVNMTVTPSAVDNGHREKILAQLDDDMFYVFMVWNKALRTHALIYDMANNILHDDKDVTVKIVGDDSLDAFLADAEAKVKKKMPPSPRGKKKDKGKAEPDPDPFWECYGHRFSMIDPYEL